jgi:hypothetical protein
MGFDRDFCGRRERGHHSRHGANVEQAPHFRSRDPPDHTVSWIRVTTEEPPCATKHFRVEIIFPQWFFVATEGLRQILSRGGRAAREMSGPSPDGAQAEARIARSAFE